jgi:hypothetical protein
MPHGQTINLVGTQPQRELYFALKREYSDMDLISESYKNRAEKEIRTMLSQAGVAQFKGEFVEKAYVFEL